MTEPAPHENSPATTVVMEEILVAVAWALYKKKHPNHAATTWDGIGGGIQAEFLALARVAVAAMVETGWGDSTSLVVATVEELDAAPQGYIAVDRNLLTFSKPFHASNVWLLTGLDRPFAARDISLPARLIPPTVQAR